MEAKVCMSAAAAAAATWNAHRVRVRGAISDERAMDPPCDATRPRYDGWTRGAHRPGQFSRIHARRVRQLDIAKPCSPTAHVEVTTDEYCYAFELYNYMDVYYIQQECTSCYDNLCVKPRVIHTRHFATKRTAAKKQLNKSRNAAPLYFFQLFAVSSMDAV